jgi:MoaA/NifB/PqqE/SkfB family radical SAM enzyme
VLSRFLKEVKAKSIHFGGAGEPLLYPHVKEAMNIVKSRGMCGSFDTNGTLLEKHVGFLESIKWDSVSLSLDGNAAIHDKIRGVAGTFEKATTALQKLKIARKSIGCTITRRNYSILADMVLIGEKLGVQSVNYNPHFVYHNEAKLTPQMMEVAVEQLASARELAKEHGIETNADLYKEPRFVEWIKCKPRFCYMPFSSMFVDAKGNARICCGERAPIIGNISNQTFTEIWKGKPYEGIREFSRKRRMHHICLFCNIYDLVKNEKIDRQLSAIPLPIYLLTSRNTLHLS